MSEHDSRPLCLHPVKSLGSQKETFENHTATMLSRSSALKKRLNKAVKKMNPLGAGMLANTQIQTREPGATESAAWCSYCLLLCCSPFLFYLPGSQAEAVSHSVLE